ncbi:MAG: hypothetical protein KDJ33_00360 [Gammaproteobacteria bacterium]|nr:hypothetical protein [Gammaproteobacteria bacterium]
MRYQATEAAPIEELPLYSQSEGLHFMLNFTVALALVIGVLLLWLGRRGRVLWLQVWSAGLVLASVAYLGAAILRL